jgi:type III restriction enzyme
MDTYWIPGVNNRRDWGRWAFAEFTDVWTIQFEFAAKVEKHFNEMIDEAMARASAAAVAPLV